MKNQENVFVMNVNGDMFLLLEGLAYSRRYQNMRYLIQAYRLHTVTAWMG